MISRRIHTLIVYTMQQLGELLKGCAWVVTFGPPCNITKSNKPQDVFRVETETADTKDTTEGMPEIAGKEKTSQPKMDHDVNHTQENAAADKKEGNEGYNENGENSTATYSGEQEVENDGKTNEECKNDNVGDKVERDNGDRKEKEAGQLEPEVETTDEKVNINVGKTEIIYQNMEEPEQSSGDMTIDPSLVKSAYANF